MGDESRPSIALLDHHVHWLDNHLDYRFRMAKMVVAQNETAKAGLTNLSLWLGCWLRSAEIFQLQWCNVNLVEPAIWPYG